MNKREIITDVVKDFTRESGEPIEFKDHVWVMETYKDLNDEDFYGVCASWCFYLYNLEESGLRLSVEGRRAKFERAFKKNKQGMLDITRWIPRGLKEVIPLSDTIFEMAKDAYYGLYVDVEGAKQYLARIIELRESIENDEYKYRSKETVMKMYETELSESTLDVALIKGDKSKQSERLKAYIKEIEERQ